MLKRIMNLIRGFLGLFITGMEKSNPKALLEVEKENLRKQMGRFNEQLANHAGFCERLMRQVKNLENQERDLAAKAAAHLKAGNTSAAGQYALQLRTVKEQLEENRVQLTDAEKTYKDLEKTRDVTVSEAKAKIEKLSRMISETELLEAQAELQEMSATMVGTIGGSGDTLNRVEEYLSERRDKAAGRAAKGSIDMSGVEIKAGEQEALAQQALAEFAASYGLEMPGGAARGAPAPTAEAQQGGPAPGPARKDMGPVEKN